MEVRNGPLEQGSVQFFFTPRGSDVCKVFGAPVVLRILTFSRCTTTRERKRTHSEVLNKFEQYPPPSACLRRTFCYQVSPNFFSPTDRVLRMEETDGEVAAFRSNVPQTQGRPLGRDGTRGSA